MTLIVTQRAENTYREITCGLRAARQAAARTQAELSTTIGVHTQAISDWELGKYKPSLPDMALWAQALEHHLVVIDADGETPLEPPKLANESQRSYERRRLATPLTNRRLQLGLDEDELGQLVGVTAGSIKRWEAARIRPGALTHIVWAQALGYTLALQPNTSTTAGPRPAENRGEQ